MPHGFTGKYKRLFWIVGLVVLLDQITKAMVMAWLPLYHSIPVIPGCFNLTHIHNPGGAFGFLAHQSPWIRHSVFLVVSTLAAVLIFYFYRKTPESYRWLGAGFALILGGAAGNLIDRFRFGEVVDFLDFFIGAWHWPAFNVADSAVSIGMAIFVFHLLFHRIPEE
jgi:signal peptidase II